MAVKASLLDLAGILSRDEAEEVERSIKKLRAGMRQRMERIAT